VSGDTHGGKNIKSREWTLTAEKSVYFDVSVITHVFVFTSLEEIQLKYSGIFEEN
jgi:hypothetical protein